MAAATETMGRRGHTGGTATQRRQRIWTHMASRWRRIRLQCRGDKKEKEEEEEKMEKKPHLRLVAEWPLLCLLPMTTMRLTWRKAT